MKELAYHVLDIANNSVRGQATVIEICIDEDVNNNFLRILIKDNGKGIDKEMLKDITNPFTTSRTMRKVGLGLPLLLDTCSMCDGELQIESQVGVGTKVIATMAYDHIDRPPLGNISSTMVTLISSDEKINIIYEHKVNDEGFSISTNEIKEILDDVPIQSPEVVIWLKNYINENINELKSS